MPFDFSEVSKNALDYTVSFVGLDTSIKILLVHITMNHDKESSYKAFETIKSEYAQKFQGTIEWMIERGSLLETILILQKRNSSNLVIIGTSGVEGEGTEVSNAAALALKADDCPVLVVPKLETDFKIKKIALVLGKGKIEDTSVLGALLRMARRFDAQVVVLTIKNEDGIYGYSKTEETNENLLKYHLENFYEQHAFIEGADIVHTVGGYVERHDIDMIAVLPRNQADKSNPSEGKLTKALTMNSKVPVLVID